ncbi:bifunctional diguanylate cyclase/phosphohydrolase [Sporomusa acidovorans]|uniref:Cyclic di-GMP phosphodiesterase response regulator RpfG n=1 Tax=Sporomusa acidovorans (strain ATCC 49682 / DSM 3132 / Mol) TaxID=1123286 RepID=A0ABZ3IVL9_SPOA4|nr:HD domain-containing phosphohydrolase [Sporomusa acidovorans]OZC15290.1 cyclic di-GMP phosphodiesterase response regulator RpfG [Sporomusa acidovorans DSM 3132]SDE92171.1 diguanylate cyclase (GGDEF) domain-containing protein [Sporomusa acidovorans]
MPELLHVLVIEDSEADILLLKQTLLLGGYLPRIRKVDQPYAMLTALSEQQWDIVIADYSLPKFSSLAALKLLKQSNLDIPFIIVTRAATEEAAVTAMKAGAHDYIRKDSLTRLIPVINREIHEAIIRRERRKLEESLTYLKFHDPLTGLYNRTQFLHQLEQLQQPYSSPIGIMVSDLDGLKLINDTWGPKNGDYLLKTTANILQEFCPENASLYRIGGDEFALLLPCTTLTFLGNLCNAITQAVDAYNQTAPLSEGIVLSLSMGFAITQSSHDDLQEVFKTADNNMYRKKLNHSQSNRSAIVQTAMKLLEARDFITEGHGDRLQLLVARLGTALGLPENRVTDLRLLAQFHDVGKVGIPDNILFKPGRLTPEEFTKMKRHSEIGYRIAQASPDLSLVADYILKHHEWWNGNGYPLGLAGKNIPLECRILSIADAYDAMTSDRPYRKALKHEQATSELLRFAGIQFDPDLVEKFLQVVK